jgi:hypothetical protein
MGRQPFRDAIPVAAQPAANAYWRGRRNVYDKRSMRRLLLPHPYVWCEWQIPGGAIIEGRPVGDDLIGIRCGALLSTNYLIVTPDNATGRHDHGFDMSAFMINRFGEVVAIPVVGRVSTNPDGHDAEHVWVYGVQQCTSDEAEILAELTDMLMIPAWLALEAINGIVRGDHDRPDPDDRQAVKDFNAKLIIEVRSLRLHPFLGVSRLMDHDSGREAVMLEF